MMFKPNGFTEPPFARFLLEGIGMKDCGFINGERVFMLKDNDTNLLLHYDGQQYSVIDGRPTVSYTYWKGHLDNGSEAIEILFKFGGNLERELPK